MLFTADGLFQESNQDDGIVIIQASYTARGRHGLVQTRPGTPHGNAHVRKGVRALGPTRYRCSTLMRRFSGWIGKGGGTGDTLATLAINLELPEEVVDPMETDVAVDPFSEFYPRGGIFP